jgi:hypothetical protein
VILVVVKRTMTRTGMIALRGRRAAVGPVTRRRRKTVLRSAHAHVQLRQKTLTTMRQLKPSVGASVRTRRKRRRSHALSDAAAVRSLKRKRSHLDSAGALLMVRIVTMTPQHARLGAVAVTSPRKRRSDLHDVAARSPKVRRRNHVQFAVRVGRSPRTRRSGPHDVNVNAMRMTRVTLRGAVPADKRQV